MADYMGWSRMSELHRETGKYGSDSSGSMKAIAGKGMGERPVGDPEDDECQRIGKIQREDQGTYKAYTLGF